MNSYYTLNELKELGLKSFGKHVYISKKSSIYGAQNIQIGDHVRIDDFCILSGKIQLGNYVHLSAYTALYGSGGIKIGNFCGCSPRTTIYSATDDFSGNYMVSPMVPDHLTKIYNGEVILENYVQLGSNSIVMPNLVIREGCATGAFSFINKSLDAWGIYVGQPCRKIKDRSMEVKKLSETITK